MSPLSLGHALGVALLLAGTAGSASAQAQPDRAARVWAASCAACHGTDGRGSGAIPPLAGREAETLLNALLEFKGGKRPQATVMHQHAKGYSDEQLKRLAAFFAALPAQP